MNYDLMLLADPGPDRAEVLRVLDSAADIRPDPDLEHRFWLQTPAGDAQINIGTKDPVESLHVEFPLANAPLRDRAAERSLELADALGMRVEDVVWGHEVTPANLPELKRYWTDPRPPAGAVAARSSADRPWWRFW